MAGAATLPAAVHGDHAHRHVGAVLRVHQCHAAVCQHADSGGSNRTADGRHSGKRSAAVGRRRVDGHHHVERDRGDQRRVFDAGDIDPDTPADDFPDAWQRDAPEPVGGAAAGVQPLAALPVRAAGGRLLSGVRLDSRIAAVVRAGCDSGADRGGENSGTDRAGVRRQHAARVYGVHRLADRVFGDHGRVFRLAAFGAAVCDQLPLRVVGQFFEPPRERRRAWQRHAPTARFSIMHYSSE